MTQTVTPSGPVASTGPSSDTGPDASSAPAGPLLRMTQTTPTVLWNDSADPSELAQSIAFGAVGATCNPVIALAALKADLATLAAADRGARGRSGRPRPESELGWQVVEELSVAAAARC